MKNTSSRTWFHGFIGIVVLAALFGSALLFTHDEQEQLRFNHGLVHLADHVEADSGISLAN